MVDVIDFQASIQGSGSVPAAAHSLRECREAMARRRRQLADLGYPVTPMLAHMWARGGGRGRFLDYRETAAGVCSWPRSVCESVGERWRDGAGSLPTFGFSTRWCGMAHEHFTVGQRVAGGSTRDVATLTGAQLSSDSGRHVQARRALRSRFSGSRISRPVGAAWRKCTVMCGVRATGRTGDANQRAASSNSGQVSQSSMVD